MERRDHDGTVGPRRPGAGCVGMSGHANITSQNEYRVSHTYSMYHHSSNYGDILLLDPCIDQKFCSRVVTE